MLKLLMPSLILSVMFISINVMGQERGVCGTHDHTLAERVEHNRRYNMSKVRNGEKVFIPIIFHNSAKNNGSGRTSYVDIVKQMDKLNNDYEISNADITFYLDSINDVNNSDLYDTHATFGQSAMDELKAGVGANAMNVFITKDASHGGTTLGTILGYYSPGKDWVVIRKQEIGTQSNTLSHEGGHFYSLPHTFYGWEFGDGQPYDPEVQGANIDIEFCPGTNMPIETMDRTDNCDYAADKFCDTPPDYNFGFVSNGCSFDFDVWDINGDKIETMINNQMSYFSDCDEFIFTPEQVGAVKADVASPERAYLRHSYVPDTTSLPDSLILTMGWEMDSSGFMLPPYYDELEITWEPVEGAERYAIDISGPALNVQRIFFNGETSLVINNLIKNQKYFAQIVPFTDGSFSAPVIDFKFIAGIGLSANTSIEQINSISVNPNPVQQNSMISLEVETNNKFSGIISIVDLNGRLIGKKINNDFNQGNNTIEIPTGQMSKGFYLINISSENGTISKKIIVQ